MMCYYFDCRVELALWAIALLLLTVFAGLAIERLKRNLRLSRCAKGDNVVEVLYANRNFTTYKCECGEVDLIQHHDRSI